MLRVWLQTEVHVLSAGKRLWVWLGGDARVAPARFAGKALGVPEESERAGLGGMRLPGWGIDGGQAGMGLRMGIAGVWFGFEPFRQRVWAVCVDSYI